MTSSWQDDLPPIPSERILDGAVREGSRRRARRRERRQRMLAVGGVGALAAVVVVGVIASSSGRSPSGDDAASVSTEAAAAATVDVPVESTVGTDEATEGTDAPADTAASETTSAAAEATTGGTAAVGPIVSDEVVIAPGEVWERAPGGAVCGPIDAVVTYRPEAGTVATAVVRWSVADTFSETPMTVTDGVATATIGPLPADTLAAGDTQVVVIVVSAADASGAVRELRSPIDVLLRDCAS